MSRIRSVHPGLASDEAFMSMSIESKAAWPLLWTECDDHGVFEWKPIVLKARIFPANNIDFTSILDELTALNCVQRFESGGRSYGVVRNFCAYQRPKSPSYRHPFPDELTEYVALKSGNSDTSTEPLPQSSPSPTENPPQMKEEGGNRKGKGEKKDCSSLRSEARARKPAKVAHQWPDGFALDPDLVVFAEQRGFTAADIRGVWESFRDHHQAKGSRFVDWRAAWRTWVNNQVRFDQQRGGNRGPPARNGNTFLDIARQLSEPSYDHRPDDADLELPGLEPPRH